MLIIGLSYAAVSLTDETEEIKIDREITIEDIKKNFNYLLCRAIAENRPGICDSLKNKKEIKLCRQRFNSYKFESELTSNKRITPRVINFCLQSEDNSNVKDCQAYAESYVTGKITPYIQKLLGDEKDILVSITGDDKYCSGLPVDSLKACRDEVIYKKAIKSGSSKRCSDVQDERLEIMCELYFNPDKKICEAFLKSKISNKRGGKVEQKK